MSQSDHSDEEKNNMDHVPNAYIYNFWSETDTKSVEVTYLMPNGVIIPFDTNRNTTLAEIKQELWEESSKYPLHGVLKDSESYIFLCINLNAESEELRDESRRLCDIKPFFSILRLIEVKNMKFDENLNSRIGNLIGKGLQEFTLLKNSEVNDFRWKMKLLSSEIVSERKKKSIHEKILYQFPASITSAYIPRYIKSRLIDRKEIKLIVKFKDADISYTFVVPYAMASRQVVVLALNKRANALTECDESPPDYALKICGREEYLLGDKPLIRFTYVQDCISRDMSPTFVILHVDSVPVYKDHDYEDLDSDLNRSIRPSFSSSTLHRKGKYTYSYNIQDQFKFNVNGISKLNCNAANQIIEVGLEAGLFHGEKSLCQSQKTKDIVVRTDGSCEWEETLSFDIKVCDIPRNTRLCCVLYEVGKTSKGIKGRRLVKDSKQEYFINPLCWANTTIYDFKSQLKTGAMTLYTWAYAEDIQNEDLLHPLGTVVSNPYLDQAAALMLTFPTYPKEQVILYPSLEKMVAFANTLRGSGEKLAEFDPTSVSGTELEQKIMQLQILANRDSLHELHEQERKNIWSMRRQCIARAPAILTKLLQCVEWNDHKEVAEVTSLLFRWPKLSVAKALELLDYAYADQTVRSFAVNCLKELSDEDLSLYLLQLVQALKHENFLACELTEFLLRRSLNNQRLGHFLFWHLRSEMHVGSVSVRFGLILEAYCRGIQEHMPALFKQIECLDKLKTACCKVRRYKDRKVALQYIQDYFKETYCQKAFFNVVSPLNPSFKWSCMKVEDCRVMDSKMKPLRLVFENVDSFGEDVYLIFKYGDDLRQDMLTLQMLRIMDNIWKKQDLDFRMNPYGCISTGIKVGLIEIVLNAETIANIQKEKGTLSATSAFHRNSLFEWLKDHNPKEDDLEKAIEEFTFSCAGYCVATYVLGIADRHSDNIMIKKTGQLFHIDFGHILGHFKEKFGILRERVPFVLTNDFVYIINKGQSGRVQTAEFQKFQSYCEDAFLILRRYGNLILSLFAMMISTGLPELSSENDLNYLRDALVLDVSEPEALKHFRSKLDEALRNSWTTSVNWASHNIAKNNKFKQYSASNAISTLFIAMLIKMNSEIALETKPEELHTVSTDVLTNFTKWKS